MLLHYNGSVVRLPPRVAILPVRHFKELKIKEEPDWVKPYYTYTDTLEHNYRWGCIYIDELIVSRGVEYLEKIYKTSPHYPGVKVNVGKNDFFFFDGNGVEPKLAYAYYRVGEYDKSIAVLNSAILNNPNNTTFYMRLGISYDQKKEWDKAIDAYKRGISLIKDEKSSQKWWFAGCLSNMYGELKNDEEKKRWRTLSDSYNPRPGVVY
jgi:tetratricopeptide (TPR) repeat protein